MGEYTTLSVSKDAKAMLDDNQRDGETRNEQIARLVGENPDPLEELDEVIEYVKNTKVFEQRTMDYDDVKEACRKALQEELPEGAFR